MSSDIKHGEVSGYSYIRMCECGEGFYMPWVGDRNPNVDLLAAHLKYHQIENPFAAKPEAV